MLSSVLLWGDIHEPPLGGCGYRPAGTRGEEYSPGGNEMMEWVHFCVCRKKEKNDCDVCSYNPVRYLRLCRIKSFSAGAAHIIFFDPFLSINKGYKRPSISDAGGRKADTKTQKLVWCIVCTPMKQNWLPKERKKSPKVGCGMDGGGGGRAAGGGGGQKVRGN